ncbi:glycosyltransferase [Fulvivirga sp. 29W222]|uniref:Glycosyltransferase n=1 Tax=Fulvivirga marina TaxID=2494733 RepID=A0A937FZX1_9BACT|nr:glycosyltransferase [Fulvivirga marina]MBL6449129.1 glycosyltransferase [Fulvivirga marina]
MKKHKLVIASILKPIDDTRMYEKLGLSLGQTNKYEINIIGFYAKKLPEAKNIIFHPLFNFKRLNISRLVAPLKCFKKYLQLKPELIIINTHELLIVTIAYKILFGTRIIYDIRENYFRNILFTNSFPLLLRPLIAGYVRSKEYLSRLFFDHYFLAERQYENEFSFSRGKSTIIENKYQPVGLDVTQKKDHKNDDKNTTKINLIFTGTIAQSTGVFECIELVKKLHKTEPKIQLKIIGYCSIPATLNRLKKAIENTDFIKLEGGTKLVPHIEVLKAIHEADFGVIYYPWNKSTMNTMPTKLFEYLGNQLPILLQDHHPWTELCSHYNASITVNIDNFDVESTLQKMKTTKFYTTSPKDEILWVSEEKKLLEIICNIIQ